MKLSLSLLHAYIHIQQSFAEAQLQEDLRSQLQHENEWTEEDVDKVYVKVMDSICLWLLLFLSRKYQDNVL